MLSPGVQGFLLSEAGWTLRADIQAWVKWRGGEVVGDGELEHRLEELMAQFSEFRSLYDYRVRSAGLEPGQLSINRLPRAQDLHINCPEIGPGFRIQHGHSTWINAHSIGANFLIRHNVTVGDHPRRGRPTIGDNVSLGTGSVVFGPIRIGNNVHIGPNATVDFDVPDDQTVFAPRPMMVPRKPASVPK